MKTELPKQSLAFQSLFSETDGNSEISLRPVYPVMSSSHSDELSAIHKGKSGGKRNSTTSSLATQSKVRIDEISDSEDEAEEPKVTPPIPKRQARYKLGQYVLSMRNQHVYIVKGIVEDLDENTIEMHLHGVNHQETLQVSMNDLNYQVASADNAIWAVSKGLDIYSAEKLKTSMMMSTKVAIEEFAQKFAKTTTFLNAGNAQSYVFQQIVETVCEVIQGFQFPEDFLILRSPFALFDKRFKKDAKTVADILSNQFDMSFRNELLSTNLSLFGNQGLSAESTGLFFAGDGTVGGVEIKLLEDLRDHLPFSQDRKEKLFQKMVVVFNTANKLGKEAMALYQIQIPNDSLNTLAYASQPGGKKINNGIQILNKTLSGIKNVGMMLADKNMVDFANKEPNMDDQEYFETLNTYIFRASQFPSFWEDNWIISPQARVIMNPQYFLNPDQDIKLKVHQSDTLKQSPQFSRELLEVKLEILKTQIDKMGLLNEKRYQDILEQESVLPLQNIINMLWGIYSRDSQIISSREKIAFMENKIRQEIDKLYIIGSQKQASLKSLLNKLMIIFDKQEYPLLERIHRLTNYRNYVYKRACIEQGNLIRFILPKQFQEYEKRFLLKEHDDFFEVYLRTQIYYQKVNKIIQLQYAINSCNSQSKIEFMQKILTCDNLRIEDVMTQLEDLLK